MMTVNAPLLPSVFRLKVQRVQQTCLFELTWGTGQQFSTLLEYPEALTTLYQEWQQTYLAFYQSLPVVIPVTPPESEEPMRGRVKAGGRLRSPVDWQARLVEAEARLLYEFHRWLRSGDLFEIRSKIAQATSGERAAGVDLFLTCSPIELERLPWEAWELGSEFGAPGAIRIARMPTRIQAPTTPRTRQRRGRVRMLAILGDDTGLNFQADQEAVRSLSRVADIQFLGWQPGQLGTDLKAQVCSAIADPQGWDLLFFAGHSNETQLTGGELAIAPGVSLALSEITPYLIQARERGLQFALFNSCSGLSLAATLIDLGLSQVAVMREPIHNQVAQEFLVQFLQRLAEHRDVHEALLAACHWLKLEKNITYPSAHLIPSLFRHPDAALFRIEPSGVRQRLRAWLPTRWEAIALSALVPLSLWNPFQDFALDQRVGIQARYRAATHQVPPATTPPVLLVQIDPKSIRLSGMSRPNPIDRAYLAQIVNRLADAEAQIVGIDYLLDRQQPKNDPILGQAVRAAVTQHGTWFVFAAVTDPVEGEVGVGEATGITDLAWSMEGFINAIPTYLRLPAAENSCDRACPFAYLLSLLHILHQEPLSTPPPQPHLENTADLRSQILAFIDQHASPRSPLQQLDRLHQSPITTASENLNQLWLRPILDFSIPPSQVYSTLGAWQLLEASAPAEIQSRIPQQVVIIASGGYDEAGISVSQSDTFPVPAALQYWRSASDSPAGIYTGAEAHAYMIHHLATQRLVIPIPDLWLLGLSVVVGKATVVSGWLQRFVSRSKHTFVLNLLGLTGCYGLVSLQLYLYAAVLIPWFIPSVTLWIYILPVLRKRPNG